MIAPQIDYSDRDERLAFIHERFHCMAPACGYCGSCRLPEGQSAEELFAEYIEGRQEFSVIASRLWQ